MGCSSDKSVQESNQNNQNQNNPNIINMIKDYNYNYALNEDNSFNPQIFKYNNSYVGTGLVIYDRNNILYDDEAILYFKSGSILKALVSKTNGNPYGYGEVFSKWRI